MCETSDNAANYRGSIRQLIADSRMTWLVAEWEKQLSTFFFVYQLFDIVSQADQFQYIFYNIL